MSETTITLNELDRATLLALVGLAVAVMQSDEENGRALVSVLSQPGMEAVCKSLVERLHGEVR